MRAEEGAVLPTRRSLRTTPRPGFTEPGRALAFALTGIGAVLLVQGAVVPLLSSSLGVWAGWAASLATWVILLAATGLAVRFAARVRARRVLGLRMTGIDVLLGLAVGLAIRVVVELVAPTTPGIGRALVDLQDPDAASQFWWTFASAVAAAAIVAPLVEEVFFRGHLQQSIGAILTRRTGREVAAVVAIILTTIVFVGMHMLVNPWPPATALVTGVTGIGVGCGVLAATTKRLGGAILAHAVFNASGLAIVYLL